MSTSTRKPKLLLLAYYFPPANAIGGVRAYNMAKWLTRAGWDVTVVTPEAGVWRNAEGAAELEETLSREGVRCIRTAHDWRLLSPGHLAGPSSSQWRLAGGVLRRVARALGLEMEIGWMREAERACAGLESHDVDLILATGAPFGSFQLARRLAKRLHRPYVLDYRDLWTSNPHASGDSRQGHRLVETKLLRGAAATIAVSPGVAQVLETRSGLGPGNVKVITNGFDPEESWGVEPLQLDHFAIVYAGVFYPPKRVITPVMRALQRLKKLDTPDGRRWAFHYYGWHGDHVREEASRADLSDRVVIHGLRSRREVLSAVKGAQVSIVIASVLEAAGRRDLGIVTGKVFDAIGLGTPMLVVAPRGSNLEGIINTAGLGACFTGAQIEEMVAFLSNAIRGETRPKGRPEIYSWSTMVVALDGILRRAMEASTEWAPVPSVRAPVARSG